MREALEQVVATTDRVARSQADPVAVAREWSDPLDQELAGLLSSSLALGGAQVARDRARSALARLGGAPSRSLDDPARVAEQLEGWVHRFYRGEHAARLLTGARRMQRQHGSLGARFGQLWRQHGALEPTVEDWVDELQAAGWGGGALDPAARHLLPVPTRGGSASKRLMLFLRWMARPDDGVDLGLWQGQVPTSALVMPVDTHILRLAGNVGLTAERTASWRAAREITAGLAAFRPDDPVFYDFALCHLGMVGDCPSGRDEARCAGCGVKPVCVHWAPSGRGAKRVSTR
ncbi:MAG: DUF2400 domain-containing protein [Myxococcales bacterium]|nr:MAG: DUF2400 domain-containing protein [Myxococcales bacterium]